MVACFGKQNPRELLVSIYGIIEYTLVNTTANGLNMDQGARSREWHGENDPSGSFEMLPYPPSIFAMNHNPYFLS